MDQNVSLDPVLVKIGVGLLSLIAGLNIFFIKNLVEKIDRADQSIVKYEEQIRQLKEQVELLSEYLSELSHLKSEIAVLKYALERKIAHRGHLKEEK